MRIVRTRWGLFASTCALMATTSGTSGCGMQCLTTTLSSFVEVEVPTSAWTVERFCLDDRCASDLGLTNLSVDDEPRRYELLLDVVDPDGRVHQVRTQVEAIRYWVNGEGCDPATANAVIEVAVDGSVSVRPLDATRS